MKNYNFKYWFRYGEFEKDFEFVTILAETEQLAKEKVNKIRRWIFSIELLSIN